MPTILPLAKSEPGTVFEVKTSRGYHYVQCITLNFDDGIPILGVLDQLRQDRATGVSDIEDTRYKFFVLFAGEGNEFRRIGSCPLSKDLNGFPKFRAAGPRRPDGRIACWFIYKVPLTFNYQRLLDPSVRDRVETLTETQKNLSVATIIGDSSLHEKLESGWLPRDEI